jgi:hypothetical protein
MSAAHTHMLATHITEARSYPQLPGGACWRDQGRRRAVSLASADQAVYAHGAYSAAP